MRVSHVASTRVNTLNTEYGDACDASYLYNTCAGSSTAYL